MQGWKISSRASKVKKLVFFYLKNYLHVFLTDKKFLEFFFKRVKVNTSGRYETEFPYLSPCGRETNYIHCDDLPVVFSQLLDSQGQVVQDIASFGSSPPVHDDPDHDGSLPPNETIDSIGSERQLSTGGRGGGQSEGSTIMSAITQPPSDPVSAVISNSSESGLSPAHLPPSTPLRLAYGGTLSLTIPFQPSSLCMLPASGRVYHAGPEKLGGVGLVKSSLAIELSRFFVYDKEEEEREGGGEGAHPVGFRWQGKTWSLDSALLPILTQFTEDRTWTIVMMLWLLSTCKLHIIILTCVLMKFAKKLFGHNL